MPLVNKSEVRSGSKWYTHHMDLKYIEDVDYVISCFFAVVCSESQFVKSICCNDYFGNVLRTKVDIS